MEFAEKQKIRALFCSDYGWVSYLHRAATTDYLCCGQALEDSSGAGRIGLTHILLNFNQKNKRSLKQEAGILIKSNKMPLLFNCDAKI